jgi:hypothetical protein
MAGPVVVGEHTKEIAKIQYIKKTNNMTFKKGDKYIHFTKYGSVNKGEVQSCGGTTVMDTKNLVEYYSPTITTTKGIILHLDGSDGKIFKIENEYTIEEAQNLDNLLTMIQQRKSNIVEEIRDGVEL